MIVERQLFQNRRHRFALRRGKRIPATVIVFKSVIDDGLGDRPAAMAAHRPSSAPDIDGQVDIVGNRLAAVVTGTLGHAVDKAPQNLQIKGGREV